MPVSSPGSPQGLPNKSEVSRETKRERQNRKMGRERKVSATQSYIHFFQTFLYSLLFLCELMDHFTSSEKKQDMLTMTTLTC